MSAPYTHTVEMAFSADTTDKIVSIVDERFALIVTDATYREVTECQWKATRITDKRYRVALHNEETNAYIISQIR